MGACLRVGKYVCLPPRNPLAFPAPLCITRLLPIAVRFGPVCMVQTSDTEPSLICPFAEPDASGLKCRDLYLRNLAYRMNKNRKAHYSLLQIDAPAAAVHEVERQHRISEDILRYLTIRVDEHSEDPSPILSSPQSLPVLR